MNTQDFWGRSNSKLEMLNYLIFEQRAVIMNLIELTEEEYEGILKEKVKRDHDTWRRLNDGI
jgi:hypothetical protein